MVARIAPSSRDSCVRVESGGVKMMKMMLEMRDRMKSRVGIYGTGWQVSSAMGLILPFVIVLLLTLVGFMFIHTLQSL